MFCHKCGKEILDESLYCPACGAKVGTEVVTVIDTPPREGALQITPVDQSTIDAIERLLPDLKKISDLSEEVAKKEHIINYRQKKVDIAPAYIIGGFFAGIPLGWIFLILFIRGSGTGSIRSMLGAIIGASIGVLILISSKNSISEAKKSIQTLLVQIDDICKDIDEDDISVLPPSYRFYHAANFFRLAFINQRALTMQQAVNLYEDELRKDEMAQIQRQQMSYLRSIRTTSEISATASTLNFLSKLF